jgi:RNA polymerase sigma factor (sigma-70 family)
LKQSHLLTVIAIGLVRGSTCSTTFSSFRKLSGKPPVTPSISSGDTRLFTKTHRLQKNHVVSIKNFANDGLTAANQMEDHELKSLLKEIRAGNPDAFERFYLEFVRRLVPFFTRHFGVALDDAQDLTHDVMLRIWSSLRTGTQEFGSVGSLRSYVRKAAGSALLDWQRRLARSAEVPLEDQADEASLPTPQRLRITNPIQDVIEADAAVAELTDTQWRAFILFERYGLTYLEIAEVERCTEAAVRGRLEQARAKIAKWLDQQHDISKQRNV